VEKGEGRTWRVKIKSTVGRGEGAYNCITERYIRRVTPTALSRAAGWVTARRRPAVAWPNEKWPGPRRRQVAADGGGA